MEVYPVEKQRRHDEEGHIQKVMTHLALVSFTQDHHVKIFRRIFDDLSYLRYICKFKRQNSDKKLSK